MRAHSGHSGRIHDGVNITNARAFRAKSGRGTDVRNILNARPFMIFRIFRTHSRFPEYPAQRVIFGDR